MMNKRELKRLADLGNVVPLVHRIPADLDTPVSVFLKLARNRKRAFLLESIEGGEKLARYSFIGFDPFLTIRGGTDTVELIQGRKKRRLTTDPVDFVDEMFRFYKPAPVEGLPRFTGGGVGYFAYDTIRRMENIPDANENILDIPPILFSIYSHIIAFDHLRQEIVIIANLMLSSPKSFSTQYQACRQFILDAETRLRRPLRQPVASQHKTPRMRGSYTQPEFERLVRKAQTFIKEGDIFQVVLSQSWKITSDLAPISIYRGLRRINPSPYMYLLLDGDLAVIGSSPEMLVRVENNEIETRPIAGTRPRGKNEAEDIRLEQDLLADPKELAEHTMLLDLGRNDIGRVAQPGTVAPDKEFGIERYSHVMHIVSSVKGRLRRGITPLQALYECFPAGTVSGAPKIRAMEIIDDLEKHRRGVYAGAIGYLDFHGNLDSCIAIRTLVKEKNTIVIQAGAGIVADSKPRREYEETVNKAKALYAAIESAGKIEK